jgi:PAS domain S-box-containing protein
MKLKKKDSVNLNDLTKRKIKMFDPEIVLSILEDLKETKEQAMESEEKFRKLFESSNDAMMTLEPPLWKFTSGNIAIINMFNVKDEKQFITLGPWQISPKYQPDGQLSSIKAKKMIGKAMKTGSNFFEWTHKKLNGDDFFATVLLTRVKLKNKTFLQATVRNITEKKKAEEKIRVSEKKFRSLFDNSTYGISITDLYGNLIDANGALLKLLGYTLEELKKKTFSQITPKKWHKMEKDVIKHVQKKGFSKEYEKEYIKKNGEVIPVSIKISTLREKGISMAWSYVRDISEKKKAEKKLIESEKKRRIWLDNSPACTKIVDLNLNLQYMSSSGVKGLKIKDISKHYGKRYPFHFYPKSFKDIMTSNLKKSIKTGEIIEQEAPVVDINGNEIWFHSTIVPVRDDNGKMDYLMVVSIETTKRNVAREALKESEEKFRVLAEQLPAALFLFDLSDSKIPIKIVDVNKVACQMHGFSKNELIGKSISFLDDLKTSHRISNRRNKILLGKTLFFKGYHRRKNGEIFPIEVFVKKIKLNNKDHAIGVDFDVTNRMQIQRKLESSEKLYRNLVDTSKALIWKCDSNAKFIYLNKEWEFLLGYKLKEMIGMKISKFKDISVIKKDINTFKRIIKGEEVRNYETIYLNKKGEKIFLSFNASLSKDEFGNVIGTQGTAYNITALKKAKEELEIRVKERTAELEASFEKLKELDKLKTQFLSFTSHELRTPLTPIQSQLQRLMGKDLSKKEVKGSLEMIYRNTTRLDRLINDVLDISRITSKRLKIVKGKVDFKELVGECIETMGSFASSKGIKIKSDLISVSKNISLDKDRMRQVFINLFDNAIRHSNAKNVVVSARKKTGGVEICVKDDGKGISKEDKKNIFEMFFVGRENRHGKYGAGLGLAIVKGIIEGHGGKISLTSSKGRGSDFCMLIPLK